MGDIKMDGTVINNIRCAYDTVIIAETESQLQQLMDTMVEESEAQCLFLNSAKLFTIVLWKSDVISTCKITVHGNILDEVDTFVFLGILFMSDG